MATVSAYAHMHVGGIKESAKRLKQKKMGAGAKKEMAGLACMEIGTHMHIHIDACVVLQTQADQEGVNVAAGAPAHAAEQVCSLMTCNDNMYTKKYYQIVFNSFPAGIYS